VLYDSHTTAIVAAIELDDRTHDHADRRKRDRFLDAVLNSTGVPLLRIRASARYRCQDICNRLVLEIPARWRPTKNSGVLPTITKRRQPIPHNSIDG
jgi:hypothetical protein